MAISKKGKRSIHIRDAEYLWWVYQDTNFFAPCGPDYMRLCVLSIDGKNSARYQLGQSDPERSHVWVDWHLREVHLQGLLRTPTFETDPVTPRFVATLVEWLLSDSTVFKPVNFQGYEGEIRQYPSRVA